MKTHQVNLTNGQTVYGLLSRVNVPDRVFYLFKHDEPQLGLQAWIRWWRDRP
jgi:hypothetical protein